MRAARWKAKNRGHLIAALQACRAVLGDALVDAALAPLLNAWAR